MDSDPLGSASKFVRCLMFCCFVVCCFVVLFDCLFDCLFVSTVCVGFGTYIPCSISLQTENWIGLDWIVDRIIIFVVEENIVLRPRRTLGHHCRIMAWHGMAWDGMKKNSEQQSSHQ